MVDHSSGVSPASLSPARPPVDRASAVVTPVPPAAGSATITSISPTNPSSTELVNLQYVRAVVFRYLSDPSKRDTLTPVLATIFRFSKDEEAKIQSGTSLAAGLPYLFK